MTYQALIDAAAAVIAARRSVGVPDRSVGSRLAHLLADAGFNREMLVGFESIIACRLDKIDKDRRADNAIECSHANTERSANGKQGTPAADTSPTGPGADGTDHVGEPTSAVPA